MFQQAPDEQVLVSRLDVHNPLASQSEHGFDLDGAHWPSVEHYYQAMKFDDPEIRTRIRGAPHPRECGKLAKGYKRQVRKDWKAVKKTIMTRGLYVKCRTHPDVARVLLATGERRILESSQYDYYWGCGRDGRGYNVYGNILMQVRTKLREISKPGMTGA